MNVLGFIKRLKTDPHITELKGRSHRLSHQNGLFEASFQLSADDREEFERRSQAIEDEMRGKLEIVSAAYDEAVANARATAKTAHEEARAAYEAQKWALFGDYFKLPTREQIAIAETPVGEVVRVPENQLPLTAPAGA